MWITSLLQIRTQYTLLLTNLVNKVFKEGTPTEKIVNFLDKIATEKLEPFIDKILSASC